MKALFGVMILVGAIVLGVRTLRKATAGNDAYIREGIKKPAGQGVKD